MISSVLRRWPAGLLALLIAGCGLSDYEKLMQATQDRVKRFDDETERLGDPVIIPTKRVPPKEAPVDPKATKDPKTPSTAKDPKPVAKDPKAPKATKEPAKEQREAVIKYPFFLRLPRVLRNTPDLEPKAGLLYRYPKTGYAVSTAATSEFTVVGNASGIIEAYLAFGNEPQAQFVDRVIKVIPHNSDAITGMSTRIDVIDRKEQLSFDVREFNDSQSAWSVYAHTEGTVTVAIAFRMEKAAKANLVQQVVELSLSTLAMGSEASNVIDSFNHRPK
jgi:hypothetical protein